MVVHSAMIDMQISAPDLKLHRMLVNGQTPPTISSPHIRVSPKHSQIDSHREKHILKGRILVISSLVSRLSPQKPSIVLRKRRRQPRSFS